MIWGVTSQLLDETLPRALPFLANMAERSGGRTSLSDLIGQAKGFDLQIWVAGDFEAVAITRTWEDALSIEGCVGENRERWAEALEDEIRRWGKATGKKRLFIHCRPGWAPWLKSRGYRETHRELMVELT